MLATTAEYNTTYNFNFIAYIFLFKLRKPHINTSLVFVQVYVMVSTSVFPVIWFAFLVRCLISIRDICGQLQVVDQFPLRRWKITNKHTNTGICHAIKEYTYIKE